MIRFVDIRSQDIGYNFCFWNTISNSFIRIGANMAWDSWQDFLDDCKYYSVAIDVKRFKELIPDWAIKEDL